MSQVSKTLNQNTKAKNLHCKKIISCGHSYKSCAWQPEEKIVKWIDAHSLHVTENVIGLENRNKKRKTSSAVANILY